MQLRTGFILKPWALLYGGKVSFRPKLLISCHPRLPLSLPREGSAGDPLDDMAPTGTALLAALDPSQSHCYIPQSGSTDNSPWPRVYLATAETPSCPPLQMSPFPLAFHLSPSLCPLVAGTVSLPSPWPFCCWPCDVACTLHTRTPRGTQAQPYHPGSAVRQGRLWESSVPLKLSQLRPCTQGFSPGMGLFLYLGPMSILPLAWEL